MQFETIRPWLPQPVSELYDAWNGRPSCVLIHLFQAALIGVTYQAAKRSGMPLAGAACLLNLVSPWASQLGVAGYLVIAGVRDPLNPIKVALAAGAYFSTTPLFENWYKDTSVISRLFIMSGATLVGCYPNSAVVSKAVLKVGFRHISEAACVLSLVDPIASRWGITAYFSMQAADAAKDAVLTKNYIGVAAKVAIAAFACLSLTDRFQNTVNSIRVSASNSLLTIH